MKKIVIINRSVWVGGVVRRPGDVLDVSDGVANDMCGALRTARPYVEAKDGPPAPAASDASSAEPAKKTSKKGAAE